MTHPTKPLVEALAAGDWIKTGGPWFRLDQTTGDFLSKDGERCDYVFGSLQLTAYFEFETYTPPPKTVRKKFYSALYYDLKRDMIVRTEWYPSKETLHSIWKDLGPRVDLSEQFFEVPEGT